MAIWFEILKVIIADDEKQLLPNILFKGSIQADDDEEVEDNITNQLFCILQVAVP